MSKIPCEVIRDLLPSYVEELTSDTTNQYIKEHLEDCIACTSLLNQMRTPDAAETIPTIAEKKEIDFLKKNRRRNKWIILGSVIALVLVLGVIFVTRYMIGEYQMDPAGDYYMWNVVVDDNHASLDGWVVNDIFKITSVSFEEEDGVLTGKALHVPSGMVGSLLYGDATHTEYTASAPIRQIIMNERIIWNEGDPISTLTSRIYQTRHLYVGDMPANGSTARALNISSYLGPYLNELQTSEPPYGWTFELAGDIPSERLAVRESDMESFGYVLLAVIDNLEKVHFTYTVDGKAATKTITAEDASKFLGENVKDCYADISLLNKLIQKTGLNHYTFSGSYDFMDNTIFTNNFTDAAGAEARFPTFLNVVNMASEDLQSISMAIYKDGELMESQGGENADGSVIAKGQLMQFGIAFDNRKKVWEENALLELELSVTTPDGTTYDIPERLRTLPTFSVPHDIHITGDSVNGFHAEQ